MINNGAAFCIANLIAKAAAIDRTARSSVQSWAKEVMTISYTQYCPVDTGTLRNSSRVDIQKNSLSEFFVRMSYNTDYAVFVHELPYKHKKGQWKFLSEPVNNMSDLLLQKLQSSCGAVI